MNAPICPLAIVVVLLTCLAAAHGAVAPPVDRARLAEIDAEIEAAIERGEIPGAVLLIGRGDETLYHKAYGHRSLEPQRTAMTPDTIFDVASLTKTVATATSVMKLVDEGRLDVSDRVAEHLPSFGTNGKERITVEHLLLHRGGLIPDNPLDDYRHGHEEAMRRIDALEPQASPGTRFIYTDVGYIVLARLVEAIDGRPIDRFAAEEIFEPLGMNDTAFTPPAAWRDRIAPTEKRDDEWMIGQVHDPRAYALGGVAGHAGLFSTAEDLARWCRMILRGGEPILSKSTVTEMTRPRWLWMGDGGRAYGFDVDTRFSSPRGERFPRGVSFGHTGFTGTSMWLDPGSDSFVILLTNRVHPEGGGKTVELRRRVGTLAAEAILGPKKLYGIPTGIDVLQRDDFATLRDQRVALITNHTGVDRAGRRTIDLLVDAPGVNLVKLFSPEHGLEGKLDERVGHGEDEDTGLKVFSLYGETRRPTDEMLEGVDTLVFDIQDIGTRFYTYIATMGYAMEEAAKHGIRMVVLDRPNPIGGVRVAGPLATEEHFGFTAYGPLPLIHGMTVGELARMFNTEYEIGCELTVVEMDGWRGSMWYDETGLMWINPSPNMRNLTQALVYPGVGLIEACNVSVGRGTDQPFETFGAPWIDGPRLAAALNAHELPGVRFVPIAFTPESSKFADERCEGVYLAVTDRSEIDPVDLGLVIVWTLHREFGRAFDSDRVVRLLQNPGVLEALLAADDPLSVREMWREDLEAFKARRQKYLIYPR